MSKHLMRGLAATAVVSLALLAGCSSGGGQTSTSSVPFVGDAAAAAPSAHDAAKAAGGSGGSAVGADFTSTDLVPRAVIKTATISLRAANPQSARDGVDGLLARFGGSVDTEQSGYYKSGRLRSSDLVLRVPVDSFAGAMTAIERLGKVEHASSTSKDVTTQVIDVQQQLRTLRISLHDLNGFQKKAVGIGQLLRYEAAITQRRGQYQSLKAQRDYLASQTSYSTIDLDISAPPRHVAPGPTHHAGFITGLDRGWHALTVTVLVALNAVGAALPFALLLVVLGLPTWWLVRRGVRARVVPSAPVDPA